MNDDNMDLGLVLILSILVILWGGYELYSEEALFGMQHAEMVSKGTWLYVYAVGFKFLFGLVGIIFYFRDRSS